MVSATWKSHLNGLISQKDPWNTGVFSPPLKFYNWIHIFPFPFTWIQNIWLISGSQPLSLACPCSVPWSFCSSAWPMWRQQMPICNEKSFLFSHQNKNLKHWKFQSRTSAHEVSRPWVHSIIQLSSNHLKANLSSILVPNSSEFASHYPLASAMLLPLALLTCMNFGEMKSGRAPDPFHREVCFDLLHLLEVSQNIIASRHLRGALSIYLSR